MAPHTSLPPAVALDPLVASSNAPVLLLDDNLTVLGASKSFCRAFQIQAEHVAGRSLAALGNGEWDVPQLISLLKATASGFAEVDAYEMQLIRPGRENRCLILNATKLDYADDTNVRVVLTISDITDTRIADRLKEDLAQEKEVLLRELHHRVANSLQIIASVLMQSARKVQSEETRGHLVDAHQRVMSVASLQQQLAASRQGDVQMRPYLMTLCESIGASMIRDPDQISLDVRADDGVTTADASVSLGLIVTELVINALKHAFPGDRKGKISVDYKAQTADWTLSVTDDGVGMPMVPGSIKPGLGTSIIQALTRQLGASINVAGAHPGTKVSIAHLHVPASINAAMGAAV